MPAFRPLHGGNSMLDRLSHFLEGKYLDLPHPLARDADFMREHSKRDRVFGQAPRFEDPALASVESRQGLDQRLAPIFQLFVLDQDALLARRWSKENLAWSEGDIASFLADGMNPAGDFAGGAMADVIRNTALLSVADRAAIATYIASLPPKGRPHQR
jgi:hypothetical protein